MNEIIKKKKMKLHKINDKTNDALTLMLIEFKRVYVVLFVISTNSAKPEIIVAIFLLLSVFVDMQFSFHFTKVSL